VTRTYHPKPKSTATELVCDDCGRTVRAWVPVDPDLWPLHLHDDRTGRYPARFTRSNPIEAWRVER
jgi:hypothetical protein